MRKQNFRFNPYLLGFGTGVTLALEIEALCPVVCSDVDPNLDPLVRCMDPEPDPSIIKKK